MNDNDYEMECGPRQEIGPAAELEDSGEVLSTLAKLPDKALLSENGMAAAFGVNCRTIRRMVDRYELPPPIKIAGKSRWFAGRVLAWFEAEAERAEKEAFLHLERIRQHSR